MTAYGKVYKYRGGPLNNINIEFYRRPAGPRIKAITNDDGVYKSNKIPKGEYWVSFRSPRYISDTLSVRLKRKSNNLQRSTLYPVKKIKIKYTVNLSATKTDLSENCDTCETREVELKTKPQYVREVGSGYNFKKQDIMSDGYGPKSSPHIYFRQEKESINISTGSPYNVKCVQTKNTMPFKRIVDGQQFNPKKDLSLWPVQEGNKFLCSIEDGEHFVKIEIIDIQTANKGIQ